ncbi:MAG: hypothetical protein HYV27_19300 [Candidatus Hydrogenedentes bacterium]|nr:hypothetical protein [Candidatus Hydrogenedentota bacterium]
MDMEPFVFNCAGKICATREIAAGNEASTADAVNRFALRPLAPEEYAIFTMDLCNNQIDRHYSRFPMEELEVINALTPGRPLMERHDVRGSLPRGTFFQSRLHQEGEHVSVRPDVYVLQTEANRDFIQNIEGGVYRETSIGFSFQRPECSICGADLRTCAHVPGRSYGAAACHFVMRGVQEVLEGSVVASGSQGTRFLAGARSEPPLTALEQARRAFHEPITLHESPFFTRE